MKMPNNIYRDPNGLMGSKIEWSRLDPAGTFSILVSQPVILGIVVFIIYTITDSIAVLLVLSVIPFFALVVCFTLAQCSRQERIIASNEELVHEGIAPTLEIVWGLVLNRTPSSYWGAAKSFLARRSRTAIHFDKIVESKVFKDGERSVLSINIDNSERHQIEFPSIDLAQAVMQLIEQKQTRKWG